MRKGKDNPTAPPQAPIRRVLSEMTGKHCGAVSIVDGKGSLVGLVTDYDVRVAFETRKEPFKARAQEIMNPKPTVAYDDMLAADAALLMSSPRKPFHVLPVLNRRTRKLTGLIRMHELRGAGL